MTRVGGTSLWSATMPVTSRVEGAPLDRDVDVDVAIVGAGYTGLWTAHALASRDPTLRIALVERHDVGFGASGRNGGWCSALLATSLRTYEAAHGRDAAIAAQRALHATVEEVGRFAATAADDAGWHRGGTVTYARGAAQQRRLQDELDEARAFGFGPDDVRWMEADEIDAAGRPPGTIAATITPHCAALHPLRLVHAIAGAVVDAGVALHTQTAVEVIEPHRLVTSGGTVHADVIVLATEAYTATLPGRRRDLAPVYSLMVGSDVLRAEEWDAVGLTGRPTFHDARHLVVYGQRTADGRIAFGGRGAPYHFGSRIDPAFDDDRRVRTMLVAAVRELFPALHGVAFPFHWGGPLGVPRDWRWGVRFDRRAGIAVAGGYVGDGVATTNLAGRTLADLIVRRDTDLVHLPWVGHRSRRWEPEPLRWLGVNLGRVAAARADVAEVAGTSAGAACLARARATAWSRLLAALTGH
jgi:glycine/D-amino acid oxidase-like deaminating enzyme